MNNKLNNVFFLMQSGDSAGIVDELKKKEGIVTPFLFHELLFYAIQKKNDELFNILCGLYVAGRVEVDIDKDFASGQNALSLSVIQNNLDYFQKLLLLGASPYKTVGLNLSKMPKALKNISGACDNRNVTPLSLMVDLSRIEMINIIKSDADKKAFVKEALRIVDKKDKKDILNLLIENTTFQVKEMLFLAAKENNSALAESLLKLNKIRTIDFVNIESKTPLIEAVQNKSYDVVDVFKTLLEKEKIFFDVNYASGGTNPLNEALKLTDEKMIKNLLFMGASPTAGLGVFQLGNDKKEQELSPLIVELQRSIENKEKVSKNLFYMTSIYSQVDLVAKAVQLAPFFGGKSIYRLLLNGKNDLSQEDVFIKKMISSVQKEDVGMVNFLLQKKVSPTDIVENQTALHVAAREGKIEILNLLLKEVSSKKIDTSVKQVSAFETAVWNNQEEAAIILLKAGAKVPECFASGDLVLSRIIDFDMGELLKLCLSKKLKTKTYIDLKKALWQSVTLRRNRCVSALLDMNVNVNFENIHKIPLIVQAAKKKNYQAVKAFFKMGVNLKVADKDGMTALHYAIQNRMEDLAVWLIDKGVNVNAQNKLDQTPLMIAMEKGLKKVAIHLIRARADASITDVNGKKAIDYYRVFKNKKIILNNKEQKERV